MKEKLRSLLTREMRDRSFFLKFPQIVSVSGKGGVGKTNVVTNLAFALAELQKDVLVLDGDLGLPNIHTLLGLVPKYTLSHFLKQQEIPLEFIIERPGGITILPGSSGDLEPVNLDEGNKLALIRKMELIAKDIDIILIDTEAGLSSNVLFFHMIASKSIIIITPEPTSINNALAIIKELSSKNKAKKFEILVNWVQNKQEARDIYEKFVKIIDHLLGQILSLDFLGFVPFDEKLQQAVRNQRAILDMSPQAPSSYSFRRLAKSILERTPSQEESDDYSFLFRSVPECCFPARYRADDGKQVSNFRN